MKDLSYKKFFGGEVVPHEKAILEYLRGGLISIIQDENNVSEKSFGKMDEIIKFVEDFISDNQEKLLIISDDMYKKGKRLNFIYETIYDMYKDKIKMDSLNESIVYRFKDF